MIEDLNYEYKMFLEDMKRNEPFCKYFDEDDYEDEYSHNEISEWQEKFMEKVKKYLHENKPGQYVVTGSWCIFVMTIEEAKKRNFIRVERYLVD